MGVSGFGPAPQVNPGEFERRLREGVHRTGPNDAPSNLPRTTDLITASASGSVTARSERSRTRPYS
jgi:hypothetical protein